MMVFQKRSMDRYDLHLPAILTFENEAGKQVSKQVVTQNVCAGGCYCETSSTFSLGTDVNMNLTLTVERIENMDKLKSRIAVSGKVIRRDKKGIAVCFNKKFKITVDK